MLGKLTCLETLKIAASLKLGSHVQDVVRLKIINDIVQLLDLTGCLATRVENMSGGERKRLSIGVELVNNPSVMFFDEPISGLDSSASLQIVTHLRELAQSGRTIVCVVHQPSSKILELFDSIYVVGGGQCIYNGKLEAMLTEFQKANFQCPDHYNRADFALEVARQERLGNFEQLIETNRRPSQVASEDECDESTPMLVLDTNHKVFIYVCFVLLWQYSTNLILYSVFYQTLHEPDYKYGKISVLIQFLILTKRSVLCTARDFVSIYLGTN